MPSSRHALPQRRPRCPSIRPPIPRCSRPRPTAAPVLRTCAPRSSGSSPSVMPSDGTYLSPRSTCLRMSADSVEQTRMANGLEGVVAAETVLSHADGERGIIWVRGHAIPDLVAQGFEAAVALIWEGFAGESLTRSSVIETLGEGRALAFSRLGDWLPTATRREPLARTRLLLAACPDEATPAQIAAALPVGIAALIRSRHGKPPIAPDPSLTTAADFLRTLTGQAVEDRFAQALDAYMTTVIDNGLSASTFAAR